MNHKVLCSLLFSFCLFSPPSKAQIKCEDLLPGQKNKTTHAGLKGKAAEQNQNECNTERVSAGGGVYTPGLMGDKEQVCRQVTGQMMRLDWETR